MFLYVYVFERYAWSFFPLTVVRVRAIMGCLGVRPYAQIYGVRVDFREVKNENRIVKRKKHEAKKKNIRSKKKKCSTYMDMAGTIFPDRHDLSKQLPYSECEGIYF